MEYITSIIITMCHHHHLSDSIWRRFWQGRRIFQHIPPFFTSVHPPLSSLSLKSSSSSLFSNHHRSYHILHILLSPLPVWRCFASKAITAAHENIRCVRKHNEKKQKMHTCASSTHCCSLSPRKQDGDSERRTLASGSYLPDCTLGLLLIAHSSAHHANTIVQPASCE